MIQLITNRLILRDLSLDDVDDMFEYARLDDVGPKAGWTPHTSKGETKAIIVSLSASNEVWAIEHQRDHKMIGTVGIHHSLEEEYPTLGIVLSPQYHGQGLAHEAVVAIVEHTFLTTALECILAYVYDYNTPSKRLLASVGFIKTLHDNLVDHNYLGKIVQYKFILDKDTFHSQRKG